MGKLKLEVGKTYLDGTGLESAIVINRGKIFYDHDNNCFLGDGTFIPKTAHEAIENKPENNNIIAEHKEPVVQERWLVILKNAEGEEISVIHTEKQDTSRFNRLKVVNQQKITYTEGE